MSLLYMWPRVIDQWLKDNLKEKAKDSKWFRNGGADAFYR